MTFGRFAATADYSANPSLQPTCYGLRPSDAAELKRYRYVLAASDAASVRVSTGAGNEPALALYRKHGFVEYKRWFVGPEPLELVALKLERASAAK